MNLHFGNNSQNVIFYLRYLKLIFCSNGLPFCKKYHFLHYIYISIMLLGLYLINLKILKKNNRIKHSLIFFLFLLFLAKKKINDLKAPFDSPPVFLFGYSLLYFLLLCHFFLHFYFLLLYHLHLPFFLLHFYSHPLLRSYFLYFLLLFFLLLLIHLQFFFFLLLFSLHLLVHLYLLFLLLPFFLHL